MCMVKIMEGRGVRDGPIEAPRKHLSLPQANLPGLGGHQQIKLGGEKRWNHGNKLDISIGGVQLEKMSISY